MKRKAGNAKRKIAKPNRIVRETPVKHSDPRVFPWMPITDEKIQQAAQKIADTVHPEKIILFGSFAYGEPSPDSDVDFFVVMESELTPHKRHIQISEILSPRPFPVDIIVRTPSELRRRLEMGDCFIQEIIAKGKVLYDRSA